MAVITKQIKISSKSENDIIDITEQVADAISESGISNGTITVYRDSYATSDFALVGFKGPGISDGGLIFSPYVTGLMSKTIADADFSPRIGVMSRYALTETLLGAGRYYRLINYTNLATTIGLS